MLAVKVLKVKRELDCDKAHHTTRQASLEAHRCGAIDVAQLQRDNHVNKRANRSKHVTTVGQANCFSACHASPNCTSHAGGEDFGVSARWEDLDESDGEMAPPFLDAGIAPLLTTTSVSPMPVEMEILVVADLTLMPLSSFIIRRCRCISLSLRSVVKL